MKKYSLFRVIIFLILAISISGCGFNSYMKEYIYKENSDSANKTYDNVNSSNEETNDNKDEEALDTDEPATIENNMDEALDNVENVQIEDEPEIEEVKAWNLHYIDAWGEWHDTMINPYLSMHDYNWDLLENDGQNISYEDDKYTIKRGIDVSHHQGAIDWAKVKEDGYEFAILRIGYRGYGKSGSLNKDKRFSEYFRNAQEAGLDIGVYIFSQAINEEEALAEAELVISVLDGAKLSLPVVYDPESIRDDAARTDEISGEQFTKNTIAFCERIKEAGYEPMIYSNMIWEADFFDMSMLQEYKFWYADYELVPQTPYKFVFWQYSSEGKVNGIAGNVDLDIWFINK